jgi:hypothetical protein
MKHVLLGLVLLAALTVCGRTSVPSAEPSKSPSDKELRDVQLSLKLTPDAPFETGRPVNIQIEVIATRPVELEFSTSQRFEIVVTSNGTRIWSSSTGKVYAQVLGKETIAPGEGLRYGDVWTPTSTGEFLAAARITATNRKDLTIEKTLQVGKVD